MDDIIDKLGEINDIFSNELDDEDKIVIRNLVVNGFIAKYKTKDEELYDKIVSFCTCSRVNGKLSEFSIYKKLKNIDDVRNYVKAGKGFCFKEVHHRKGIITGCKKMSCLSCRNYFKKLE